MAKTNISFNNKNYSIPDESLSAASAALKSHLSTVMNGTGATINLGGTAYSIDSAKLSSVTSDFTSYLRTIAGGGGEPLLIEWDGNTEGLTGVICGNAVLYKVSDLILTDEEFKGSSVLMHMGENEYSISISDTWDGLLDAGIVTSDYIYAEVVVVVRSNNVTIPIDGIIDAFPEPGIYFAKSMDGNIQTFSLSNPNVTVGDSTANIVVNGVKYPIDYSKLTDAIAQIEAVLGGLNSGSGDEGGQDIPAGLYETGSNYTVMKASWDELVDDGVVDVDNGFVYTNFDFENWISLSSDELAGDLVIPDGITGLGGYYPEDGVDDLRAAFMECVGLTGVIIPNSVTAIGEEAFTNCKSLTKITIPGSVKYLGYYAFFGCENLSSVIIEDGVEAIGDYVFCDCKINNISIPNSLKYIGNGAFQHCTFTSIALPNGLEYIGEGAFWYCESLTDIVIPNSVSTINMETFYGCFGLNNIIFDGTIEQWNNISLGDSWNNGVPATYVQCSDGKVFINHIIEGDGQVFHRDAPEALTFRCTIPLNEIKEVQINGYPLETDLYTATTDNDMTVITLPIEFLNMLDLRQHELTVISESQSVSCMFRIVNPED